MVGREVIVGSQVELIHQSFPSAVPEIERVEQRTDAEVSLPVVAEVRLYAPEEVLAHVVPQLLGECTLLPARRRVGGCGCFHALILVEEAQLVRRQLFGTYAVEHRRVALSGYRVGDEPRQSVHRRIVDRNVVESTGVDITGKQCVVVGRSNIVGKPQAMLLLQKNGTVTICHSKTKNLKEICLGADILVVAVGKAKFVTGDMVKEGAVVIDVGMDRDENGKLCGDVDFESAEKRAAYITPVPGGVGPMTIAMLMKNTLTAAKQQAGIE